MLFPCVCPSRALLRAYALRSRYDFENVLEAVFQLHLIFCAQTTFHYDICLASRRRVDCVVFYFWARNALFIQWRVGNSPTTI